MTPACAPKTMVRYCPKVRVIPRKSHGSRINCQWSSPARRVTQCIEFAATSRGEEGVDHLLLTCNVLISCGKNGSLYLSGCSAGQLPARGGAALNHERDLLEGQVEHIVEHERKTFRWLRVSKTTRIASARLTLSQVSWTASSVSANEPSIRYATARRCPPCSSNGSANDCLRPSVTSLRSQVSVVMTRRVLLM
jgi:hypothetical protein